jgi:heme exporter protein D
VNWGSLDAFIAMGGYGLYVWGSFLVTTAALAIEIAMVINRRRSTLQMLAHLHSLERE